MQALKRGWLLTATFAICGAAMGWLYWRYFGCTNGCSITGSPLNSSLYGALMGALLHSSFKKHASTAA